MKYTSPWKRSRVLLLHNMKKSIRQIHTDTGVPKSTVADIIKRDEKSDECYEVKAKIGRPKIFSIQDSRLAARKLATRECSDATDVQRTPFPHV